MRQYVTVSTLGVTAVSTPEIILMMYGPRGGIRATESLSPDEARELVIKLTTALKVFEPRGSS